LQAKLPSLPAQKKTIYLKDRLAYKFPVRVDRFGRSHIFNSVALDLTAFIPEIINAGINSLMVDARILPPKQIKTEINRVKEAIDLAQSSAKSLNKRSNRTTGRFFSPVK
jgi:collagenase-like PrtC family protease